MNCWDLGDLSYDLFLSMNDQLGKTKKDITKRNELDGSRFA